jgi:hypothetical protein
MNNEPVGVVCEFEGILVGTLFEQLPDGTPLYTHPAKTLTDEEIEGVFQETIRQPNFMMLGDTQRFARAILRKAQEK